MFTNFGSIITDSIIGDSKIGTLGYIQDSVIGDNCNIQNGCYIYSARIGNNVFLAPRVTILNDKYPPSHGTSWYPVQIGDNVIIGACCTILPKVIIESGVKIGAGQVITKDVTKSMCKDGWYVNKKCRQKDR